MTEVRTTFLQTLSKLPDLLKSILGHDETTDLNIEIVETHGLDPNQTYALLKILQLVIMQIVTPDKVPARVASDLNLVGDKAKNVALDLLGLRLLPMEWYIGPVQPVIKQLGGNVAMYLARLTTLYPEVYSGGSLYQAGEAEATPADTSVPDHHETHELLLKDFEDRLTSFHGRAEILLRLTGVSTEIEEAVRAGRIARAQGESAMRELDSLSFAINNHDFNLFEVRAMRRKLEALLRILAV